MPGNEAITQFSFEAATARLSRAWPWLALASLGCALALLGISFLLTPAYRTSLVMVPAQSDNAQATLARLSGQLEGLATLAGINVNSATGTKFQDLQYLRSNEFVSEFLTSGNLLPVLFEDDWDPVNKRWKDPEDPVTMNDAVEFFNDEICALAGSKETGIITLSMTWSDRVAAARWANLIVERVNERLRQRAIVESAATIRYLNDELGKSDVIEVRQSIYRLIESQIRTAMLANVRKQYAFKVIDPAVVTDEKDKVRPRRLVMTLLGGVGGLMLGILVVLWAARRDLRRAVQ